MNRYHVFVRLDSNGEAELMERADPKGEWVKTSDITDLSPCPQCGVGAIASVSTGVGPAILQCVHCWTRFQPVPHDTLASPVQ